MNATHIFSLSGLMMILTTSIGAADQYHRDELERYQRAQNSKWNIPSTPGYSARYAAIAYSPTTRKHGFATGCSTLARACRLALARCPGADASIVTWAKNAHCALAIGPNGEFGASWGRTRAQAQRSALLGCRKHTTEARLALWVFSGL